MTMNKVSEIIEAETKQGLLPDSAMTEVVAKTRGLPNVGELIEGEVLGHGKLTLYIDLGLFGTGIIFGREYLNARDVIKKIKPGDKITAKIVELESEDSGYIELSLKEARQAAIWKDAEIAMNAKTPLEIAVKEANKGGLIMDWQGIMGFLPASQLKSEHYPRVVDGDKDKILMELKGLIGTKLTVAIIAADAKESKLIFSEKGASHKEKVEMISKYHVGDVVEGEVTGAVDFGIFMKVEEGLEGLVHISEIDWALVENPRALYNVGDKISVKIIEIKDGKLSLSIKSLKENPWKKSESRYKKGTQVKGVVIRYNKHGALVSIEEGIAGLVHVSEFESLDKMKDQIELGKSYPFYITMFDAKDQRMALSTNEQAKVAKKEAGDKTAGNETVEEKVEEQAQKEEQKEATK